MGEPTDDADPSDGSYDSEETGSSGSESESDTFSPQQPAQVPLRIPSLLGRLPPLVESPDRHTSLASPQQAALPSSKPSPRDVPLSALSLTGNRQTNGVQALSPGSASKRGSPGFAPRLDLASASGAELGVRSPGSGTGSARHRSGRGSARAPVIALELLSQAFGLDRDVLSRGEAAGMGPADVVRQRAAAGLGVPTSALRLFELREVAPGAELSEGTQRVAVALPDSSLSLGAIEDTMSENKRLMATNAHTTAALETLQQLVKEQNAALGKLKVQAQEQAANARRLQERYDTADRFAQMLRQQLERSESLRVAGQRALAELKAEFEALTGELVAEGQLSGGDAAAAVAQAASVAAADQPPRRSSDSPAASGMAAAMLASPEGTRLTALLERFSDESVLRRLEQCLDKVEGSKPG